MSESILSIYLCLITFDFLTLLHIHARLSLKIKTIRDSEAQLKQQVWR